MSVRYRVIAFESGGMFFSLELLGVKEVIRPLPVTRVPNTPRSSLGIINFRGLIVPIVSFSRIFGTVDDPEGDDTRFLIYHFLPEEPSIGLVGLKVARVLGILTFQLADLQPLESLAAREPLPSCYGVTSCEGRPVHHLLGEPLLHAHRAQEGV